MVETKYVIGQRVEGTITNIVDFGAFAHLEESIEGLVHVSELSFSRVNLPSDVVAEGDKVKVKVLAAVILTTAKSPDLTRKVGLK